MLIIYLSLILENSSYEYFDINKSSGIYNAKVPVFISCAISTATISLLYINVSID
jgi:hypothetical protein